MRVTVQANEVVHPTVNYVSLVKRGANRIPFRIMKGDDEMFDLSRVFRKHDPSPSVLAAIVRKGCDLPKVKGRLKAAGLSIEKMEDQGDVILFPQSDAVGEDVGIVKLDEDLALSVSHFSKAMDYHDFESSSFVQVFATEAFRPSVGMATSMLESTFHNILEKADNPQELATQMEQAINEYRDYVVSLTKGVPVHVFKAEVLEGTPVEEEAQDVEKTDAEADAESNPDPDAEDVTKSDAEEDGAPADHEDPTEGEMQKSEASDMEAIKALLVDFKDTITKSVDGLRGEVNGLTERVSTAEVRAQKAEEAVTGTVSGISKGDIETREAPEAGAPPLLDTGYDGRS